MNYVLLIVFQHLFRVNVNTRVPLLKNEQPEITYNITLSKPGQYVVVVNYITPIYDLKTNNISVEVVIDKISRNASIILYACNYTTVCRQAIIDEESGIGIFYARSNSISLTFKVC